MKSFFGNIWTKRAASVLSIIYAYAVFRLCYFSIFYDIHIHSRLSVCLILTGVSLISIVLMLYTRRQLITRIVSFLILPAMLPVVLLYFGEWGLIMPIIATGVIILLLSGAGEGTKTAIGTITLLLYIFGALGYFIFTSFFVNPVKEEVIASGFSASERYRYRVVNTEDSSNGSTAVYVEPNYADLKYKYVTFTLKNMERCVHVERPINETADVQWIAQNRQDTTNELNSISKNIIIHLSEDQLKELGYTYDEKLQVDDLTMDIKSKIGKTASDVDPIKLDELNDEQIAVFGLARDEDKRYYIISPSNTLLEEMKVTNGRRIYVNELSSKALDIFNDDFIDEMNIRPFILEKDTSVPLNTLTDEQLKNIGIADSGDVMLFNGKIIFRDYVARAEKYFDVDSRKITVDLLN